MVGETGFNSSPVTKGVLFRATKSVVAIVQKKGKSSKNSLGTYQQFFDEAYAKGTLDRKTKHLIALGASLAVGSEPLTRQILAVARQLGATDEELKEVMALAMSIGATKIKMLHESSLASLFEETSSEPSVKKQEERPPVQQSGST